MAKERILVVDDEEDIRDLIIYNLENNGYRTECAGTGEQAVEMIRASAPDLVLLDLMLPGIDGLDVCRIIKNDVRSAHIPIIMISARGGEADVVTGLELGADDYIAKPFSPRVLLARIKAVFRRGREKDQQQNYSKHGIELNTATHDVRTNGEPAELTASEFGILHLLMRKPGWVFTRNQIINTVKGDDYPVTDRSIDVQIVGLRRKLGDAGAFIETVRGVGYRLRE
jgi:two-component system, OmpR family, alkaline phosphatase synthesis response regulator PhoP